MTQNPPISDDADQVVILGAGRSVRGALPSAIVAIDGHGRVMDWLLAAFAALGRPRVCFVAGYQADYVVERYPDVRVVFNREWDTTGPVHSLRRGRWRQTPPGPNRAACHESWTASFHDSIVRAP